MATTNFTNGITLTEAEWFDDVDTATYQHLTSVSGTNTITATGPVSCGAYAAGQRFEFIPANTNTGATTINISCDSVALGAKSIFCGGAACIGSEIRAGVPCLIVYDGTQFNLIGVEKAHTRQVFLSGSAATYTTPAGCRQIVVRAKGGGGGGGGTGTSDPTNAGAGGATIFNSVNANGGGLGSDSSTPGAGGTGGSGTASVRIPGACGGGVINIFSSATNSKYIGGNGGGAGGGLGGHGAAAGSAGVANSGGGGGAGGVPSTAWASLQNWFSSGGGGEGEYFELIINSPAATYTYTVGAGGTAGAAGTGGQDGAAGGTGVLIVDEYY